MSTGAIVVNTLEVVGALAGALVLLGIITALVWYVDYKFCRAMINGGQYRKSEVEGAVNNVIAALLSALFTIPALLLSALGDIFLNITGNVWKLFFLFILAALCVGWNHYMDEMIGGYLVARQCVVMPFTNFFLFPLLNIGRIVYNATIILWDFGYDLFAFYEYGPIIIFIKCTIHTLDATNLFAYFSNIFFVFTQDLVAWFVAGFLTNDLDITNTVAAVGLFVDAFVTILTCFCNALGFFWQALAIAFRLPSVAEAWNCVLNFFVRLAQIPVNTVMSSPFHPSFERAALGWCCAVQSVGDAVEDITFLVAETGWGVFSNTALPQQVAEFFSTQWTHILSDPLCAAGIFVNMTLEAGWNFDQLDQPTGIAYFQFGQIADQFKGASFALGSLFCLFNNDAIAFVTESLLTVVNFGAFLFEWILGNVWYFLFGGPALPLYPAAPFEQFANFLEFYLPNYWFRPGQTSPPSTYVFNTALNDMFVALFQVTQALGNLIANLLGLEPLAGIIQHTLNIIVCLLQITANLVSYSFPIVTFNPAMQTNARAVNVDILFSELYFLAGSAGDFFRQFATPDPTTNATCAPNGDEFDQSVYCCLGNLVEQLLDTITVALQQVAHFLQDLLVLPTGTMQFCVAFIPFNHSNTANCVRIPDLTTALFLLDASICSLSCAILAAIPLLPEFVCQFPPVPAPPPNTPPMPQPNCGHVSTCSSDLVCKVALIITVPLHILNNYLVQTINGAGFNTYTLVVQTVAQIYADWLANVVVSFGQLFDCIFCAFITHTSPNCDLAIYELFVSIGTLVTFLPLALTTLFTLVVKLFLTFIVGVFTGDPIQAVINLIVGLLENVFGGLAGAAVNFLTSLLNAIGLGFIGIFIQVLYKGFCPFLQAYVNAIILGIKALTFGLFPLNFANFCCDGNTNCVPDNKRGESQFGLLDGVLYVDNMDWMSYFIAYLPWPPTDPCNASMQQYVGVPAENLTDDQQSEILYCFLARYWNNRTDNATALPPSPCDKIVVGYMNTTWRAMDLTTQALIRDCLDQRTFIDKMRMQGNMSWIPSDWMYNWNRRLVFLNELLRGLAIYWQYTQDQTVTSAVYLSPAYQQSWAGWSLNISFYAGITTPQQIVVARSQYRLADYFAWNQASNLAAVEGVTIGFWSFVSSIASSLFNSTVALTDGETDPTVYATYSYLLGNGASGASSSMFGIVGEIYNVVMNISTYWSNPANLKKRSAAYEKVSAGSYGMYTAMVDQIAKAGVEYRMFWRDNAAYWRGERPAEETAAFLREYHATMRADSRSVVYRASHWWNATRGDFLRVYPLRGRAARDGDRAERYNQSETLFQYRDARTGRVRSETGYERLWRFYALVSAGSPASRRRWDRAGTVFTVIKERVYHAAMRNNLVFATEYIRSIYEEGFAARVENLRAEAEARAAAEREGAAYVQRVASEGADEVLQRYYASLANSGVRLVSSSVAARNYVAYRLERQALEQCDAASGGCHGFIRVPAGAAGHGRSGTPAAHAGGGLANATSLAYLRAAGSVASAARTPYSAFLRQAYVREVAWRSGGRAEMAPAHGVIVPPESLVNFLSAMMLTQMGLVAADSIINLTCSTNVTFGNSTLCEECFFLDQLLGRIENGLAWVLGYYTGGQFGASLQVALNYFDYVTNDNATVVVGGGPQYDVGGFPSCWGAVYDLGYLDDDTPNKTGLSQFYALLNSSNTSSPEVTTQITIDWFYLNAIVEYLVLNLFAWWWQIVVDIISIVAGGSGSLEAIAEETVFCDWAGGTNYLGTNKRWSVGQVLFGYLVAFLASSLLFVATIQVDLWNLVLFFFMQFVSFGLFVTTFLVIQAGFAFLCWFGLPVISADDVLYFVFYTALPKCDWFFGWAIANADYNNTNCYSCAIASDLTILNCARDLGFGDIFANIVFMLQLYYPQGLEWLRTSTWPFISLFVSIPYVSERLNAYANVNLGTQPQCRNYKGCNYLGTLFTNFFIAATLLFIVALFYPLIPLLVGVAWLLALFFIRLIQMIDIMIADMNITAKMAPMVVAGMVETPVPEHVEEEYGSEPLEGAPQRSARQAALSARADYRAPQRRRPRMAYTAERNVFSLSTLGNMARMTWDNLTGDRKTK